MSWRPPPRKLYQEVDSLVLDQRVPRLTLNRDLNREENGWRWTSSGVEVTVFANLPLPRAHKAVDFNPSENLKVFFYNKRDKTDDLLDGVLWT